MNTIIALRPTDPSRDLIPHNEVNLPVQPALGVGVWQALTRLLWHVQIQADVRTIMSRTFASRHSLRFPRCMRVRWDKSPMQVQTDQDLWDIVEANKGAIMGESCRLASCWRWESLMAGVCHLEREPTYGLIRSCSNCVEANKGTAVSDPGGPFCMRLGCTYRPPIDCVDCTFVCTCLFPA